jgi:hypothetical protein
MLKEACGSATGAEEEQADTEGVEAGDGGNLGVAHAFDVGEPKEVALAGFEGLQDAMDVELGVEVWGGAGVDRF